jgi:hypothetical protein
MEEESNPIKEYLFNYLEKSEKKFSKLFSQTKIDEIINDILNNCYYKVALIDNKEESIGVLATGILHYILTNALLTSQRKVEYRGVEVDIVIPDLKTLKKDPKKTLIICIPKTLDKNTIKEKLEQLQKIQPERKNIWLVLTQDTGHDKTYVIQKDQPSFSKIIFDIAQFVNTQGHDKFKILRV